MSRDHTNLKVMGLADELVADVYLIGLSHRFGFLSKLHREPLDEKSATLVGSLQRLVDSLRRQL